MGVLPRRLIKQNLSQVEVFLEDTRNDYFAVQDIPDTFTQGRSSFKIFGSDFLKENIKLKIEILDVAGETVYVEPIKYKYRRDQNGILRPTLPFTYITVEVYRDINTSGAAELTILGELDETQVNVPAEFVNTYNVRFQKTINIDTAQVFNTSPILFYKQPKINTQELVKKQLVAEGSTEVVTTVVTGSGIFGKPQNPGQRYYPDPEDSYETPKPTTTGGATTTNPNPTPPVPLPLPDGPLDTSKEIEIDESINLLEDTSDESKEPGKEIKQFINSHKFVTGDVKRPPIFGKRPLGEVQLSEEAPVMKIFATGSGTFNSQMVGGEIRIPKESIRIFAPKQYIQEGDVGVGTGFGSFPSNLYLEGGNSDLENAAIFVDDYTASIERVVNSKEIHVREPFYFKYGPGGYEKAKYYLSGFGDIPYIPQNVPGGPNGPRSDFTMSFQETVTQATASHRFDSFIDFDLRNLRTFSGDVYRVKISGGSQTSVSDFPVLLETIVESPELLVDQNSPSGFLRTGYFQNQAHTDKYWNSSANLTATYQNFPLIDAMKLSGSFSAKNANGRFDTDTTFPLTIERDVVYTLSMRVVGRKGPKIQKDNSVKQTAKIFFHLSGSNLSIDDKPNYENPTTFGRTITDEFGRKVGLELTEDDTSEVNYGKVSHTFSAGFKLDKIRSTNAKLQFRIESGEWEISDVSLRPAMDTGFSPDNMKVRVPIPINTQRPDKFAFLIQYYDVNNVEAETFSTITDVDISGSALVVEGDDNMLTGSLFIGDVVGKGIEMHGGSSYIRSIGYLGFTSASAGVGGGFFMWSGSALREAPDNYTGAGLEIHDGNTGENESFLKFRTIDPDNNNNSTLEIRTSRFFLGNDSQFISGANGNLQMSSSNFFLGDTGSAYISGSNGRMQITSSNFHLRPDGSVIMQGTITAEAGGTIGGFTVGADNLTATNFVLNTTNKSLTLGASNNIFIADADTGIQLGNATFGSAPFSVTNAGVLKAESGTIGGFTLGGSTITGGNLVLDADGTIRSANFTENLAGSGFKLTANDGGFLEVENARIRGTLKTAVFEKESVNAVGGQLYIANSTVLTGSSINPGGIHTATQNTMSVENASGFVQGEILAIKKVSPTGFNTEYVFVNSASRNDPSSDTDLSGNLFVTRSYGTGISGDSGSLGGTPGVATTYSGSQVLVSTGRYISGNAPNTVGSGYMRLNANPNDLSTPFMDIVERTGSGVYDIELKTRLGDLRGVAGTRNVPSNFTGFGLMTETAFLSGSNIILEAPTFLLGDKNKNFVSGSNSNIEISSSKFHIKANGDVLMNNITASNISASGTIVAESGTIGGFTIGTDLNSTSGTLKLKGASGQITASAALVSGSNVTLGSEIFRLSTTNLLIENATPAIRLGPSSGGSRIELDGSDSSFSFHSGSSAIKVFELKEFTNVNIPEGTGGSSFNYKGPIASFATGGAVIVRGDASNGKVTPNIFGFSGQRAFFQGSTTEDVVRITNQSNATSAGGLSYNVAGSSSSTTNTGIRGSVASSVSGSVIRGIDSTVDVNTTTPGSTYGVLGQIRGGTGGIREESIPDTGINSEFDHFSALTTKGYLSAGLFIMARDGSSGESGGRPQLLESGSAVMAVGGRIGVHAKQQTELAGFFEGTISASLVNSSGDVVAFQSSDKRLKDNLKPISQSIDKLNKLTGYEFDWNDKQKIYEGHDLGVVAQEVEAVLPELVRTNSNGFKAVKYEKIIPLLIEALKDQQEQIYELKKKLEEL